MATKYAYKKRIFLNESVELSAFMIASLQEFYVDKETNDVSCYPTLDISDCSNKISLDFCFYNRTDMKKMFKKLQKVQSTINDFAAAYEKEMKRILALPEPVKKPKKKKKNNVTSN